MKREHSDIIMLLVGLLLMSGSLGFIHRRIAASEEIPRDTQDALMMIQPLLAAEGMTSAAQALSQFPIETIHDVLRIVLISETTTLRGQDKMRLLVGTTYFIGLPNKNARHEMLSWYPEFSDLFSHYSVMYTMGHEPFYAMLNDVTTWFKAQGKEDQLITMIDSGLIIAVQRNNLEVLQRLLSVLPSGHEAILNKLLLEAVMKNRHRQIIEFLIGQGADVNTIDPVSKYTALWIAVDNGNFRITQELLKAHADPSIFADPALGTPLQHAIEKKLVDIELLLRSYGAR